MGDLKRKTDKSMMILSALGILFVIDGHCGMPLNLFARVFPYDSFFMPMFVFISGYFYNNRHAETVRSTVLYIKDKFLKLMVPYILWSIFYGVLVTGLRNAGIATWSGTTFLSLPGNILSYGTTFDVNGAAWFVPMLFFTILTYVILRKIFGKFFQDYLAMAGFVALGCLSVYFCRQGYNLDARYLMLLKIGFFIQFFHLGYFFRNHGDAWFKKQNALKICLLLMLVNGCLMLWYPDLNFYSCAFMNDFKKNGMLVPFVTSLTGILFWLKISQCLSAGLGENKLVNLISNHTFFIMEHHLLSKNILYVLFWLLRDKVGLHVFMDLDAAMLKSDSWYFYGPNFGVCLLTFLFCLFFTLLCCVLYLKAAAYVGDRFRMQRNLMQ